MGITTADGAAAHREDAALADEPHCEECSSLPPERAEGWRWERTTDGAGILYCPSCWTREFGDDRRPDTS